MTTAPWKSSSCGQRSALGVVYNGQWSVLGVVSLAELAILGRDFGDRSDLTELHRGNHNTILHRKNVRMTMW